MFNFSIQRIDEEREEEKNQSAVSNTPPRLKVIVNYGYFLSLV